MKIALLRVGFAFGIKNENDLGAGMHLYPVPTEELGMLKKHRNSHEYCYLFNNGVKVSDNIFRRGGMCRGFKESEYSMLIVYDKNKDSSWGNHVIVNKKGEIALMQERMSCDDFYYIGGVLARMNKGVYSLLTGQVIVSEYSQQVGSKDFLFVGGYGSGKVYKISYKTAEVEIFD